MLRCKGLEERLSACEGCRPDFVPKKFLAKCERLFFA
jgi:hypothetical protein